MCSTNHLKQILIFHIKKYGELILHILQFDSLHIFFHFFRSHEKIKLMLHTNWLHLLFVRVTPKTNKQTRKINEIIEMSK